MTAGLALGSFTHCAIIDDCNGNTGHVIKYTVTRTGWTFGAGIEHRLTHAMAVRADYRYTNFGTVGCNNTADCAFSLRPNTPTNATDVNNRLESHTVQLSLSYSFGGFVVASASPVLVRH